MDFQRINSTISAFRNLTTNPESESAFKLFADQLPFIIWIVDENGYCTYANKAWTDFTGRTIEEEIAYGWMEVIHPDDFASSVEAYKQACQSRDVYEVEFRMLNANGEYRAMKDIGYPRFDESDKLIGYIGTCQDITELRQAISKSEEAIKRFEILQQATQDSIWDWDLITNKVVWNDTVQTMFGYTADLT